MDKNQYFYFFLEFHTQGNLQELKQNAKDKTGKNW